MLFECSWEVANKVGGVHSVLVSKASEMVATYGAGYVTIGPWLGNASALQFDESTSPPPSIAAFLHFLESVAGLKAHYGSWLVSANPAVFLLEMNPHHDYRADLWRELRIGNISDQDSTTRDAVKFGYTVARFFASYLDFRDGGFTPDPSHPTADLFLTKAQLPVLHVHEWQAGLAVTLLRSWKKQVGLVFTTHATILGRHLCAGGDVQFYQHLPLIDVDREAGSRGIYAQYCIERGAAANAHVLTTVSTVTAQECKYLLKREPDVLTPNGLSSTTYQPASGEAENLHTRYKMMLHEFVRGHWTGQLTFDLNHTIYAFFAGRYEYLNKGIDIFLDALGWLNNALQAMPTLERTVVAFIITPAPTQGWNNATLSGHFAAVKLRQTCDELKATIGNRLFDSVSHGIIPSGSALLTTAEETALKRHLLLQKGHASYMLPPVVTHNMANEHDPILAHLRRLGLANHPTQPVKVVYHPDFLNPSANPILPLEYLDFVRGCHVGVFPSLYEPFGLTPCEAMCCGTPSITSNTSGFARTLVGAVPNPEEVGVFVLDRMNPRPREQIVSDLGELLLKCALMHRPQRANLRLKTEQAAHVLDWKNLIKYIMEAHQLARTRAQPERPSDAASGIM
ncbi:putative glycosyltransferase family 3 protein [Paratrimastix pyriformis]|uniref:Glycogen [starch] synthase n=1 Tax=Paratrimastix pyriformis TaxID=342808 RepID=A0ABQ8UKK1_9EUKA|nr:putative glycosyltransferase family 3 protein [Paratrimastix pyriformis]